MAKLRTSYLDGLRGVAALMVVFQHYWYAFFPAAIDLVAPERHGGWETGLHNTPFYLLIDGNLAVCVFFVLSGFVLSNHYFRTRQTTAFWPTVAKRYIRLFVPVAGAVLIAWLVIKLGWAYNHEAAKEAGGTWFGSLWLGATTIGDAVREIGRTFFVTADHFVGPLWTMHLEFWGSVMVFALLAAFSHARNRLAIYGLMTGLLWQSFLVCFIIGMAACDFVNSPQFAQIKTKLFPWTGEIMVGLGLLIGSMPYGPLKGTLFETLGFIWPQTSPLLTVTHSLAAGLIVAGLLVSWRIQGWLNHRVAQLLGRISFSVYLLHFIVLNSFSSYLFVSLRYSYGYRTSFALMFAVSLALIFGIAVLYERYVDAKAIKLSHAVFALLDERRMHRAARKLPSS